MTDTILIIEDEALLGRELERHYSKVGWKAVLADSLTEARKQLLGKGLAPLAVLSDMSLPDGNALDLLEEFRDGANDTEWVFLTGYGSVADSVRALRLGAIDFLEKPVDFQRLDLVMTGAVRSARAHRRLHDQASHASERFGTDSFVGGSAAASRLREMLGRLCEVPFSALVISGETGTGKGVVARILHHAGTRASGPLVEVNCATLPRDLLESELFGHEAGAFTGARGRRRGLMEQADGGTLFLDEIGEIEMGLQAKLLKAIEEKCFRRVGGHEVISVDVQVVAASNRDLEESVRAGEFRDDLYHRLSVVRLELPPLRERIEDLDELVPLFVREFNAKSGRNVRIITESVWDALRKHEWPGNVRELRNVIERCVLFSESEEFPQYWLQLPGAGVGVENPREDAEPEGMRRDGDAIRIPLDGSLGIEDIDRYVIVTALEMNHHNVTATARALNTTRDTIRYRVRKYGIAIPDES